MKTKSIIFNLVLALALAMALGLTMPMQRASAADTTVLVNNLQPTWTAPGGGGVWSAYYAPDSDSSAGVSPGSTAVFDGREAGIIKAGITVSTDGHYWDEGLLAFKVPNVDVSTFAGQALRYDVENQTGPNPVWVRIRLDSGAQYQFVPTTNPASWHTVDAAAGAWYLMDKGNATGGPKTLAEVAADNPGKTVDRVYLTLGMGDSYNVSPGVGTVGWVDKVIIGTVTYDFVVSSLGLTTDKTVFCGSDVATVSINLSNVVDLYGYQFQVAYGKDNVSASGAFDNSFFDTNPGPGPDPATFIPWNADCTTTPGVCKFSVSKVEPQDPVSGSGTVAKITFTGIAPGEFTVTVSEDILANRDGGAISHTTPAALNLTVCGLATVSGVVKLQGRATPIDTGTVTFTNDTTFPVPVVATFDAGSGIYSAIVKYLPGGTNYKIDAAHGLYLGNQIAAQLVTDDVALEDTKLKGGDANNDGTIEIGDLTCIGGDFGGAPDVCGTTGSSDINLDGVVNILDLVLPGGNYGLNTPQGW